MKRSNSGNGLGRAVISLLRLLVRLMLKRGIAFEEVTELAKRAYVESAQSESIASRGEVELPAHLGRQFQRSGGWGAWRARADHSWLAPAA